MSARERELRSVLNRLLSRQGLIHGTLLSRQRVCGKPNCRCARGREDAEPTGGGMHWCLSRPELSAFAAAGLTEAAFEDYLDEEKPPVRRFLAEYRR